MKDKEHVREWEEHDGEWEEHMGGARGEWEEHVESVAKLGLGDPGDKKSRHCGRLF